MRVVLEVFKIICTSFLIMIYTDKNLKTTHKNNTK